MKNVVYIKRGTTPKLPIIISMPVKGIQHIDFVFKKGMGEHYPSLLEIGFDISDTQVEEEGDSFVVELKLTEKDTRKLTEGIVYMDTRIILTDGNIPPTEIVELEVGTTLFKEG